MRAADFCEITKREEEGFIKPMQRGPLSRTAVERKMISRTPQKYQYYDGNSAVVGSPFDNRGKRNKNFVTKNFISNSVFYNHQKDGYDRNNMYTTTNGFHLSKSVERMQQPSPPPLARDKSAPKKLEYFRPKTSLNTNMTTMQNDFVGNIHQIYRQKLGLKNRGNKYNYDSNSTCRKRKVKEEPESINIFKAIRPPKSGEKSKSRNPGMER